MIKFSIFKGLCCLVSFHFCCSNFAFRNLCGLVCFFNMDFSFFCISVKFCIILFSCFNGLSSLWYFIGLLSYCSLCIDDTLFSCFNFFCTCINRCLFLRLNLCRFYNCFLSLIHITLHFINSFLCLRLTSFFCSYIRFCRYNSFFSSLYFSFSCWDSLFSSLNINICRLCCSCLCLCNSILCRCSICFNSV